MKKDVLKRNYELVAKDYAKALCHQWHISIKDFGWIGEIGGACCFNDDLFLDLQDVIYCVDNDIDINMVRQWTDYCIWAHDYNFNVPNLQSWHKGCPRVSIPSQIKITQMHDELKSLIEKEKELF